jgi:methyl-accepting chemotaxis protein
VSALPSRRDFLLRFGALTAAVSLPGVALMALYLAALLRLPAEEWTRFLQTVAVAFPLLCALVLGVNRALYAPVLEHLARAGRGERDGAAARRAYRRVTELPRLTFLLGEAWWTLGGVGVALAMSVREPAFTAWAGAVMVAAAASGGLVVMIVHFFLAKRQLAPLRVALARELRDPAAREALRVRTGVGAKLVVSVTGVTLVVVAFTLLLADALASRPLAAAAAGAERAFAEELARQGAPPEALARAGARARTLVAESAERERRARHAASALVLALGVALAGGVAALAARDLAESTRAVGRDVERIAAGDLREAVAFEGDDELGTLARSVERMTGALRETIGRVAAAADEVEGQAGRLARVAADVAQATTGQVDGIRRAAGSMDAIGGQIGGITGSARSLSQSVEESSSSIVELGAAGEQLHATAGVLGDKVDMVGSSIERMAESVRRVVASADDLAESADATAGGLEQMAAAMGGVGEKAAETARLSERVVDVAERGRERVHETIEGMEAIRGATELARSAIRDLARRVEGIGAILGVIDDVAEETNLLALNAAIIAAQAGDQGRAFSVVADEIKELADRVLENTQEIGAVIRAVQQESQSAADAMERGVERVGRGVGLAAEAGVALGEITRAARQSGDHIRGIASAVREQADASSHIVGLMARVRERVDQIRTAGVQHERGHEVVQRGALAMREVAAQLTVTTGEQARGTAAIARSAERVQGAVAEIHGALQEQGSAAGDAAAFLEQVHARTRSHEESARTLARAAEGLAAQAHELRESSRRFVL